VEGAPVGQANAATGIDDLPDAVQGGAADRYGAASSGLRDGDNAARVDDLDAVGPATGFDPLRDGDEGDNLDAYRRAAR
jgi:hypothetical protein